MTKHLKIKITAVFFALTIAAPNEHDNIENCEQAAKTKASVEQMTRRLGLEPKMGQTIMADITRSINANPDQAHHEAQIQEGNITVKCSVLQIPGSKPFATLTHTAHVNGQARINSVGGDFDRKDWHIINQFQEAQRATAAQRQAGANQ